MPGPWALLKDAYRHWSRDEAPRRAAALAYYTMFSIVPLVLILLAVVGLFFGEEAARAVISDQVRGLLGDEKSKLLLDMVQSRAERPGSGIAASAVGFVTLLMGASAVVGELQSSLSKMWDVPKSPSRWRGRVFSKLVSVLLVVGFGCLMLASLGMAAGVSAAGKYLEAWRPVPELALQTLNAVGSAAVLTAAFTFLFKLVPRARMAWHDALMGGALTSLLFTLGSVLLGLYLGKHGPTSVYGAAGSLLAVLLWTYYTAQIVYFGAEFTQVYARARGWRPPALT